MKVLLDIYELKNLLIEAAKLGAQQAERERNLTGDNMSEREAHRWVQAKGLRPALLDKLVDDGLVKPKRKGTSKNSPKMYSRVEVQAALAARDYIKIFIQ